MGSGPNDAKAIFLAAVERKAEQDRNQYLDEACAGNPGLRRRVEELLSSFDEAGSFMEQRPRAAFAETITGETIAERPGSIIGPYKLLQLIGEGGFGVVYMAEQTKPVRRKVALKIIKPGMDTREVIARFEAERQALALMDHPNIAKVLDAGATNSGRPYFVMELVKGVPLIEFCSSCSLSTRHRLELFVMVCRAVQHAHHKGIIHRDLKPSNVIVTLHDGQPVPKVIDFGVSKAISQQLTERTLFTAYGQMIGTPAYMSPEQAEMSGLDIDTRSDIYSLGVLLYELLTGSTPLDAKRLRGTAYAEVQRLIREEEAPKPSTRLSTLGEAIAGIAKAQSTEPRKLNQFVRGDLDWIVMKALEKDRNRRYETANSFAADIGRFLGHEAVEARPPSTIYRLHKFARRNKVALVTAILVTTLLVFGIVGTTWQAIRATHERNRAVAAEVRAHNQAERANKEAEKSNTEAAINQAVLEFVNNDLLGQADPHVEPDRNLKLSTVLHRASERIEGRFYDQPGVEASIRWTLGETCQSLGEYQVAREHLERALELTRRQYGDENAETLRVLTQCAWLDHDEGHYRRAESSLNRIVKTAHRSLGKDDPLTLSAMSMLADVHRHLGNLSGAEALFQETIAVMQRVLGAEHRKTLECRNDLAIVYAAQGRLDEATTLHSDVLDVCRRVLGSDHPRTIQSIANLGDMHVRHRRYAEAEELYLEAINRNRRVLGTEHPRTLTCMMGLAQVAAGQGRQEEAESLRREVLKLRNRVLGPAHRHTILTLNQLAAMYRDQRQHVRVELLYREQIGQLKQLVADAPEVADYRARLAVTYRDLAGLFLSSMDRPDEAETCYQAAIDLSERLVVEAPDDFRHRMLLAELHSALGRFHRKFDRLQDSKSCFEKAADHFNEVPEDERRVADWGHFGQALYRAERYKKALVALEKVIELRGDEGPNTKLGPRWWYMIMTLHQLGETEQARTYFDQLFEQMKVRGDGPHWNSPHLAEAAALLGVQIKWNEQQQPPPQPNSPTGLKDTSVRGVEGDKQP